VSRTRANRDGSARGAIGAWLVTMVIACAAAALVVLGRSSELQTTWGFAGFGVLMAITFGTVGLLISVRVPGNRIGWLFAAIGLGSALQELIAAYVLYGGLVAPGALPWVAEIAWFEAWDWVPVAGIATTFLFLLFPDGRPPSPRWRPVAWLAAGAILVASIFQSIQPGPIDSAEFLDNPLGLNIGELAGPVGGVGFGALVLAVVLSVTSMVVRFRRSRLIEREQLKWFASAAVLAGLVFAGLGAIDSANKAFQILTIVALLGLPISAGIAILRYRLYDIDRIISRTVSYGAVTGILAVVFIGTILVTQTVLASFFSSNSVAVAASTLVAAALFQPLRRRIQSLVDRRFNRSRYDAEQTVTAFGARLRDEVDLANLDAEVRQVVAATVAPVTVGVWIRQPGA
jgi:hypothetical protein